MLLVQELQIYFFFPSVVIGADCTQCALIHSIDVVSVRIRSMANQTNSRKEDGTIPVAAVSNELAAHNVGDVVGRYLSHVGQYLNDKLPRDLHPSFNQVGHEVHKEPRPALRAFPQSEPTLKTTTAEKFVCDDSGDQDDAETWYVLSLRDHSI